jgi:hypothetical protein
MRLPIVLALLLAPLPARAWEFSPLPICTIRHEATSGEVAVTFDPATGIYAIDWRRAGGWPAGAAFSITFEGSGTTISTARHAVAGDTVRVEDRGFGNVLAGLEAGGRSLARLGGAEATIGLDGAAEAVAAFRACPSDGLV